MVSSVWLHDSARSPSSGKVPGWIAGLAFLACSFPVLADKTDVVHLRNGDRVTCEIKKMERGQLKVSTDSRQRIRSVRGFWTNEYYIQGGPPAFQVPAGEDNSWQGGYLQLEPVAGAGPR